MWDYPRPPRLEPSGEHLVVELAGVTVADTHRGLRVLETSQPPAYYFPPEDVATELLRPTTTRTFCEWKGQARYHTIVVDDREAFDAAWSYDRPVDAFAALAGHYAFYPARVDRCTVDGEIAVRQRRRLLWWVGHLEDRRSLQGRTGFGDLVSEDEARTWSVAELGST